MMDEEFLRGGVTSAETIKIPYDGDTLYAFTSENGMSMISFSRLPKYEHIIIKS